jgi:hypothetical protein
MVAVLFLSIRFIVSIVTFESFKEVRRKDRRLLSDGRMAPTIERRARRSNDEATIEPAFDATTSRSASRSGRHSTSEQILSLDASSKRIAPASEAALATENIPRCASTMLLATASPAHVPRSSPYG